MAQSVLRGDKPALRIEGDVQLAAEINWLTDHLRWDIEEDLARILGDAPANTLAQTARRMAAALREFMARRATGQKSGAVQ
jgi:ubiquinone biosynthesis protein UbiJ